MERRKISRGSRKQRIDVPTVSMTVFNAVRSFARSGISLSSFILFMFANISEIVVIAWSNALVMYSPGKSDSNANAGGDGD